MKEKLLAVWAWLKQAGVKVFMWSPLITGILIGYLGRGIISLALDVLARAFSAMVGG
jgi:hypothetical protein